MILLEQDVMVAKPMKTLELHYPVIQILAVPCN